MVGLKLRWDLFFRRTCQCQIVWPHNGPLSMQYPIYPSKAPVIFDLLYLFVCAFNVFLIIRLCFYVLLSSITFHYSECMIFSKFYSECMI